MTARPSGFLRSSARLDLPRLTERKKPESPSNSVEWLETRRDRSPSIGSTLITSAPSCASNCPAKGPPSTQVRSRILKSPSICFRRRELHEAEHLVGQVRRDNRIVIVRRAQNSQPPPRQAKAR